MRLLAAFTLLAWVPPTPASAAPPLKVERVVMLMRHGIRPPTDIQPIPVKYSSLAWPKWPVGPGLLTPRGAKGVGLLAASDRAWFISAGLLPRFGCPAPGQVTIRASHVPRAIATAEAWSGSLAPGCNLTVDHPAPGAPDPLFHILDPQPAWFDGRRAYQSALAQAPRGGLAAQLKALAPLLHRMAAILGCALPACDLQKGSEIVERPHGRPELKGPLNAASTASETFLLEYLQGMPMREVAWGRITPAEIERLLIFNTIKFNYADRPPFISKASAGPLARAIVDTFTASARSRITLLAGHDTNIADLGGLLGMHWHIARYPPDAIPPGSAIGFELLSDGHDHGFVRAFYRAQTMDQLRRLEPLGANNAPYRQYLDIPGCGTAQNARSCDLANFTKVVEARLR